MTRQQQQIILFTILALISYVIWQRYFNAEEMTLDKPFTKGYSIENIEMRITDEKGYLTAKFESPNLTRYTDNSIIHIEKPLFWTYSDGKQHWFMESGKAEYNAENDEVNFIDKLSAKTINQNPNTYFEAENLLVNLKTKKANTSDGISFKQQQLSMTGQIAQIDLKNETLEVNNNVKAVYTMNQSTNKKKSNNENK